MGIKSLDDLYLLALEKIKKLVMDILRGVEKEVKK